MGVVKEERKIVRIVIRNLSDEYMVEKRSHPLTMPNISHFEVEETVRASYANRKYSDLGKLSVAVPVKAPPPVVIIYLASKWKKRSGLRTQIVNIGTWASYPWRYR